jgi:shikimate 5-dehydrogenase
MTQAIQADLTTTFAPATRPTMYFIGVTTGSSSIMKIFPRWAEFLNLGDVRLQGIDCPLHAEPAVYRRIVEFIKGDKLSLGALVTTHKLDLFKACRDLFEVVEPAAEQFGEVSSISKHDGRLAAHAKDAITSGLAVDAIVPQWNGGAALILGAGGASIALSAYLLEQRNPSRVIITDRNADRLVEIKHIHAGIRSGVPVEYHLTATASAADALMARLPAGSLVVNATGLGKDRPGSPITDAAVFPQNGYAWDFNYRGELVFLDQARKQQKSRNLHVHDGWLYFLHGWTRVVAEVFHIDIPTEGPAFDELSRIARETR